MSHKDLFSFLFADNLDPVKLNPTTVALGKKSKCCDSGVDVVCTFSDVSANIQCAALVLFGTHIEVFQMNQTEMQASGCIAGGSQSDQGLAVFLPFNKGRGEFANDIKFSVKVGGKEFMLHLLYAARLYHLHVGCSEGIPPWSELNFNYILRHNVSVF